MGMGSSLTSPPSLTIPPALDYRRQRVLRGPTCCRDIDRFIPRECCYPPCRCTCFDVVGCAVKHDSSGRGSTSTAPTS